MQKVRKISRTREALELLRTLRKMLDGGNLSLDTLRWFLTETSQHGREIMREAARNTPPAPRPPAPPKPMRPLPTSWQVEEGETGMC